LPFGYRVFQFVISQRNKPNEKHEFSNVGLHSAGAQGLIEETLKTLINTGDADDQHSMYYAVDAVKRGEWVFQVQSSGGAYGRERRVRNTTTHADTGAIGEADAVLEELPIAVVVPPYGRFGLIIAATEGRSHHAASLVRLLNIKLAARKLYIRLTSNLADEVAWSTFLKQPDLNVTQLELTQTKLDQSRQDFGKPARVTRARLVLSLAQDKTTRGKIVDAMRKALTGSGKFDFTGAVGMSNLTSDDFDDYKVVYVKDGRERRVSVAQDYPHFIYEIDGKSPPSADKLLTEAYGTADHLLTEMNIQKPANYWPANASFKAI
jgi:hypothetical protein